MIKNERKTVTANRQMTIEECNFALIN